MKTNSWATLLLRGIATQVKVVELPIPDVLDKMAPSAELLVQATKTK